jgi:hypothetical protein
MVMKIIKPIEEFGEEITIRALINGYNDAKENGVVGFGGKLNIRPAYQREFIYDADKRDKVIKSIYAGLPLNFIYWAKNKDGTYEVIDGQQRIISICQFATNNDGDGNTITIKFNNKNNDNMESLSNHSPDKANEILDYPLQVCICSGTDDEKLEWFNTINIASIQMTPQELLNANFTGTWLTHAKELFSKSQNNEALNESYHGNGSVDSNKSLIMPTNKGKKMNPERVERQALLQLALEWIVNKDGKKIKREEDDEISRFINPKIKDYMAAHRDKPDANELWNYYKDVLDWVKARFPEYYSEMRGIDWGTLYANYKSDNKDYGERVAELMKDEEVKSKKGIFEFVLDECKNLSKLSLRTFDDATKRTQYEKQGGICPYCENTPDKTKQWKIEEMEADHIKAWSKGGKTESNNCQMLCKHHNCRKGNRW